jgi:hypothetical protein
MYKYMINKYKLLYIYIEMFTYCYWCSNNQVNGITKIGRKSFYYKCHIIPVQIRQFVYIFH